MLLSEHLVFRRKVETQPELYHLLTLIDTLRIGKKREIEIAINELDKRINQYGS